MHVRAVGVFPDVVEHVSPCRLVNEPNVEIHEDGRSEAWGDDRGIFDPWAATRALGQIPTTGRFGILGFVVVTLFSDF